ncbi:hypothetical protein [Burkholderia sp. PU8-34]
MLLVKFEQFTHGKLFVRLQFEWDTEGIADQQANQPTDRCPHSQSHGDLLTEVAAFRS